MTTLPDILVNTAGSWTLVADRSSVTFRNKTAWGLATVTGRFSEFSGDGLVGETVTGRLVVRAASLHTGITKRDNHLRSADFFDVDTYPDIVVEVTGFESADAGRALLRATLTVRGTSQPIELPVSVQVLDDGTVRVSGGCTVNRSEFEVSGNMLGMVGPKTDISADLVFTRA
ncbi:YceI family protein [Mycobacterium sp. UM_WWY]